MGNLSTPPRGSSGGALLFHEPLGGARGLFLALLIVAIVGLRWTAPPSPGP